LFRIAAHKRMDYMRQSGRRQRFSVSLTTSSGGEWDIVASTQRGPVASPAKANSNGSKGCDRRRALRTNRAVAGTGRLAEAGMRRAAVCPWLAQQTGRRSLGISEQQVANFKYDAIEGLRKRLGNQRAADDPLS
jgi:hypothetical protein